MPNNDFISNILEIKDLIITNVESTPENICISFKLERRDHICPNCGAITNKVHDYRKSIIKDTPILGKNVLLFYSKRRYHCDCCGKHFLENFTLLPKHCRITNRLNFLAINMLNQTLNVSSVARYLGISSSSIFRRLNDVKFPKPSILPHVLSIAETFFPNATIVIDRFHVVRYVTWALENVRKRIQKEMLPFKRKYFKRSRRILLSHYHKLSTENKQALEVMLTQSNDLAIAYHLKELFYDFMDSPDRNVAYKRLRKFILATQASELKEFNATLTMLANWSKYILNAFDCPYSNGFTEGTNNKIKVIKRNAYGFRNFENFRNRILMTSI